MNRGKIAYGVIGRFGILIAYNTIPMSNTWYVPGLVAPMYLESTWDGTGV